PNVFNTRTRFSITCSRTSPEPGPQFSEAKIPSDAPPCRPKNPCATPDDCERLEAVSFSTSQSRRCGRCWREDRQHLEQVSHLIGCGQSLKRGLDRFGVWRILFRQLLRAMLNVQCLEKRALCDGAIGRRAAASHSFRECREIHMSREIGSSRRFEKGRASVARNRLQRFTEAGSSMAIVNEKGRAALLGDVGSNLFGESDGGRRSFKHRTVFRVPARFRNREAWNRH